MRTATTWRGILDFVSSKLNAQIAVEAASSKLAADGVKVFGLGWQDPFRLPSYNAVFVVPDQLKPSRSELLVRAPIAFVAALRANSPAALYDAMSVYADAIANIFEADSTAGGIAFEVQIGDSDFSLPAPGAPLVGALTVLGTVSIDQLNL